MSRFFNRIRKAEGLLPNNGEDPDSLRAEPLAVERLLERINSTVDKQVSGFSAAEDGAEHSLNDLQAMVSNIAKSAYADAESAQAEVIKVGIAEYPQERFPRITLPQRASRVFYSDRENVPAPPALEAYRALRTRLLREQAKRGFRSIVVSSSSQGEGKTLTATNLALCFAHLPNYSVLLVDADLRTRGLSRLLRLPDSAGLAEVLSGSASRDASVVLTDIPNLHLLGAGRLSLSPPQLFTGAPWKGLMAWARENFKLVLVDSPPTVPLADYELISACCEAVVLVARAGVTGRAALERVIAGVDPSKLLGMALNSVELRNHSSYSYYYERGAQEQSEMKSGNDGAQMRR